MGHEEDGSMSRKRHTAEEIVAKLRQVEVLTAQGRTVAEAIRSIGVTEVSSATSCSTARSGVSEISCLGRAVDPVQAMARVKRSPKRMAN